jgi:hypothetical protein
VIVASPTDRSRTPAVASPQDHLPLLVDRLARASARPKAQWSEILDPRTWGGRDHLRRLGPWDPLVETRLYRARRDDPEIALALQRTLAFYAVGVDLEHLLRKGLTNLAATLPADHPAHGFIAHELREEAEHTAMFTWFAALAGEGFERHTSISEAEIEKISALAGDEPAVFLLYVISGELMFDRVQRAALAADDTHPLIAGMDRYHCIEEARHLSFGRGLLRSYLSGADAKQRRRLTYEAPLVARWTSERMLEMPPSLSAAVGATDEDVAEGRRAVRRSDLHRRCIGDLHRFCQGLGLVDDRLRGTWGIDRPEGTDERRP